MSRRGLVIQGAPGFPAGAVAEIRECAENIRLTNLATRQTLDIGATHVTEWVYEGVEKIDPGSIWESNIESGLKVEVVWEHKTIVRYKENSTPKELPIGSFLNAFKPVIQEAVGDAEDLFDSIETDGELYRRFFEPIAKNMSKMWKKGTYDSRKAVKGWLHLVTEGAKRFAKSDYPDQKWDVVFPKALRMEVADMFRQKFEDEAEVGNFWENKDTPPDTLVEGPVNHYRTLNDAEIHAPGLAKGSTKIYYMTPETFMNYRGFLPKVLPSVASLKDSHVLLGTVKERNHGPLFGMLQGEVWSPGGEANKLIRSKGLRHTSMSVGDVIVVGKKGYMVDMVGWETLPESLNVVNSSVVIETTKSDVSKGDSDMEKIDQLIEAVKNQEMSGEEAALALTEGKAPVRLIERMECPLCDQLMESEADLGKHLVSAHDFDLSEAKEAAADITPTKVSASDDSDDIDEDSLIDSFVSDALDEVEDDYYSCPDCHEHFEDAEAMASHLKEDHDVMDEDVEVDEDDLGEKTVKKRKGGKWVTVKKRTKKMSGALKAKMARILKKARKKANTGAAKAKRKKSMSAY